MPALRVSYSLPLGTRVFSTISSIAQFLGIVKRAYTSPADAEEFVPLKFGSRNIESYRDQLYLIYTAPDLTHIEFGRWRVSEVCTYKGNRTRALKHEYYLLATLRDENDSEIYLRFEHGIEDSYLGTGGSSGPVNEEGPGKTHESKETLPTSSLPATQFADDDRVPLPQLVVLARTVQHYLTTGHLTNNSCYSFCFIVLEMLKKVFQHTPSDVQQDHLLGFSDSMVLKSVDLDSLINSYKEAWDNFIKKIDMTINNPNSRGVLEAKRLAEEERQRAEREKERADEQARLVKDLERHVAELKATLKTGGVDRPRPTRRETRSVAENSEVRGSGLKL